MLYFLRWRKLRVYLFCCLLPPAVLLGVLFKQHPPIELQPVYQTTAKLVISPDSRGSEHEFYSLTDQRTLLDLFQDQALLEKTVARAGLELNWMELRSQLRVIPICHRENKVDMLEITLTGSDPNLLKRLGVSLISCLIERMRQLTAVEHDQTLRSLTREYGRTQKQFQASWKQVMALTGKLDSWDAFRIQQLEAKLGELNGELLKLQLDPIVEESFGPLQTEFERQNLELGKLRTIYRERSLKVQQQSERLKRLGQLLAQSRTRHRQRAQRWRQTQLARLQQEMARVSAELAKLVEKRPGAMQTLRRATLEREMQMWQEQLQRVNRQLVVTRLAREKCMACLTVVVVEKPQLGQRLEIPSPRLEAWRLWLERLPESLFFGLLLSFGVHFLRGQTKLEGRIEEAMGLPVIGRIPRVSEELCREWERIKQRSTQHPRGGI